MKQSSVMVYILVAVIALFLQACSHSSSYEEEVLYCAAKMMEEYPDSALRILREIPPSSLGADGLRAKHSLLMSMALDKNYIDTADLAVISPAIEYYIREGIGTPDGRLRTHFYEGRIYQNA